MTKEDFDAEVYEYAKSRIGTEDSRMTDRMLAYRAGAESREKQVQIDAEQIRALQKDKGELTDRVRELEAQIEGMKRYLDCEYCEHYTQRNGCKNCNEEIRSDWKLKEIKENE